MRQRGFEVAKGYEDKDIHIPVRKTAHSAGYDVEAAEDIIIPKYYPGIKPTLIPTGLKAYCMEDECYLLLNRSSGPKKGFLMANSVGLIDSDYRGNVIVALYNDSSVNKTISPKERIAQLMIVPFEAVKFEVVDELSDTVRADGGFGSTGA